MKWQTIASAPINAPIDLWSPTIGRQTDCEWDWHGGCWKNMEGRFYEDDFTHWMPLPEPPESV